MKHHEERLSALMDDELSEQEQMNALDRLGRDEDARGHWQRWHLIGDVMRGEGAAIDVSAAVRTRLEAEPAPAPRVMTAPVARPVRHQTPGGSGRRMRRRWAPLTMGGALAASLAALAWVMAPWAPQDSMGAMPIAAVSPVVGPIAVSEPAPARPQWRYLRPSNDPRLNDYLAGHGEYASPAGVSGVLPYAAFVSYTPGR